MYACIARTEINAYILYIYICTFNSSQFYILVYYFVVRNIIIYCTKSSIIIYIVLIHSFLRVMADFYFLVNIYFIIISYKYSAFIPKMFDKHAGYSILNLPDTSNMLH